MSPFVLSILTKNLLTGAGRRLTTTLSTQAIQQNHPDIAKIYAQNAIRKQNEKLNLLRLGSRIDAVASRVQTAVTMRQVTGSMAGVVRGMEGAMKAMDLEKVSIERSNRYPESRSHRLDRSQQ